MRFTWRTQDMMEPQLLYAEDPANQEVAVIASFTPQFDDAAPSEQFHLDVDADLDNNQ